MFKQSEIVEETKTKKGTLDKIQKDLAYKRLQQEEAVRQFKVVKAQYEGKLQYLFVEKLIKNRAGKDI